MTSLLDTFFATLDAIPFWLLLTVVGVLLVLETTALVGLVTPGEVVLLAAATTVGSGWEYGAMVAVAAAGTIVGQSGGYLIGRRTGPWLRQSRAGRWIGEPNWQRAERVVASGAARAIVGARFMAVAHSLVPVIAGSLRMDVGRFLRCTVIGAVAWSLVYVSLGSAASVAIRQFAHLIGPTATGLVVAAVVVVLVVRAVRRRRAERVPVEVG
jgi:membrane-associated protein